MKVAHVITRLILGGAQQNTVFNVDDQHHIHGDDVTLITGPGLGPEGSLMKFCKERGLDVRTIPQMRRNLHPWRDWSSYRALKKMLREINPQVIHTHSSKAGIMGRAIASRLKIPVVHTIHGAAFHYGQHPVLFNTYKTLERWAGKRTDRFISVCDAMSDQYVEAGVAPREKFRTIYSGMDVEPFLNPPKAPADVRAEYKIAPEHIVIGKIARLFNLKGHQYVIEAAKSVVAANPNVRFMFVGDGILREQYDADIAAAGLTDHFIFTGLVDPIRIPELINSMDIVVHTSVWEGLARVLPQGLISGKPVVSYDVDGAREVVITGETGYLLPPRCVDELSAALIELADNPQLRDRLGSTGRDRFTEQYRHQYMTERIREVYAELI